MYLFVKKIDIFYEKSVKLGLNDRVYPRYQHII